MNEDRISLDQIITNEKFDLIKQINNIVEDNMRINDTSCTECNYYNAEDFKSKLLSSNMSLSFFCMNIQSLNAHFENLKSLLSDSHSTNFMFDFIGLTDIFRNPINISLKLEGYHQIM